MTQILIVDDSATVRKLLSHIIAPTGHTVLEAADGVQALEILSREEVSLVLADLNMPQMNGIELIQAVRREPKHKDLPIVMLTTESDEGNRKKALSAGANVYLVKPAAPHLILYKIQSLLGDGGNPRKEES